MLNDKTLLVYDHKAGLDVVSEIEGYTKDWYNIIKIPEQIPSNIVSLSHGKVVIYQQGFSESENVLMKELKEKRNVKLKSLNMSEFIKADGSLTCCSILV
jgi:dimethylargininase